MSTSLNSQVVQLPAGNVRNPILVWGNYIKIAAASVVVKVKLVCGNSTSEIEMRRGERFLLEPGVQYQRIEFSRSENDTNPDVPYNVAFTYGTLAPGAFHY